MRLSGIAFRVSAVAAFVAVLAAGAVGVRALAQRHAEDSFAIRDAGGIDEAAFVPINGLEQWITIRGHDRGKPVVLVLHGGPGQAQSHLIGQMASMENDFVVVQWDQRGAGRTLARAAHGVEPSTDLATMTRDGLAVTDYLRAHLHRDRIVLLGFSWGSRLGVEMAQARPGAFWAYVGTGQVAAPKAASDAWVYQHLLARAAAAKDAKSLDELKGAGPPPWTPEAGGKAYRAAAAYRGREVSFAGGAMAALTAPYWTLADVQALGQGRAAYRGAQLERDIADFDPARFGQALALPVILIQGADDLTTPTPLAMAWLDGLKAPKKASATIPGAGHQALLTHNAAFDAALKSKLAGLRLAAR